MPIGVARIRAVLGDGATIEQARRVHRSLSEAGLLDEPLELAGVKEIAELAGVTSAAVCQWADLPIPLTRLKQGRVWDMRAVRRYVEGRADAAATVRGVRPTEP